MRSLARDLAHFLLRFLLRDSVVSFCCNSNDCIIGLRKNVVGHCGGGDRTKLDRVYLVPTKKVKKMPMIFVMYYGTWYHIRVFR